MSVRAAASPRMQYSVFVQHLTSGGVRSNFGSSNSGGMAKPQIRFRTKCTPDVCGRPMSQIDKDIYVSWVEPLPVVVSARVQVAYQMYKSTCTRIMMVLCRIFMCPVFSFCIRVARPLRSTTMCEPLKAIAVHGFAAFQSIAA